MPAEPGCASDAAPRPGCEVADILLAHEGALAASHALTDEKRKAMWDITHCRTFASLVAQHRKRRRLGHSRSDTM